MVLEDTHDADRATLDLLVHHSRQLEGMRLLVLVTYRHLQVNQHTRGWPGHTVYECSICGERQVGVRRCEQDNVFCRALGLGGHGGECDEPILLADLLELEV
jgi:hypothetical protein